MFTRSLFTFTLFTAIIANCHAQQYISQTIQYDGETREYDIYVPAVYDGSTPVPLMLNFHGGNGFIADQIAIGDMSPIADTANFIAVYPQALPDPNDGGSTNWIHKDPTNVDDVLFIDALIDSISTDYLIDQNRIYACGYSLGGEFTLSLGCRLNHRIAAISAVARTMQTFTYDNCVTTHPTGVLTILGTADGISLYDGVWWQGVQYYVSARQMHVLWAERNDCDTNATVTQVPDINTGDGTTVERHTWSTATGCAYVEELKVIGGDHDWPGSFGNMDINSTLEIWNFVSNYNLSGIINCTTTSISETEFSNAEFTVFPNPFSDLLTFDKEHTIETTFQIYSMGGEVVYSGLLSSPAETLDLSTLPPNIYVLTIGDQSVKVLKLE